MAKEKKELLDPMEFDKVEKMSDDVYNIGSNLILRFNVILSKKIQSKDKDKNKENFHKEYEYLDKDDDNVVTIRRSFDYFLSFENIVKDSSTGEKLYIRIGPQDFILVRDAFEYATTWFRKEEYKYLFVSDRNKLRIVEPIPHVEVNGLPMGKSLYIVPTIVEKNINGYEQKRGVRIYYSEDSDGFVDIDLNRLFGLSYTLNVFNMYQSALSIINYLGRPPFGTNRVDLTEQEKYYNKPSGSTYYDSNKELPPSAINGRKVKTIDSAKLSDLEG